MIVWIFCYAFLIPGFPKFEGGLEQCSLRVNKKHEENKMKKIDNKLTKY